jgi:hypothetical protein
VNNFLSPEHCVSQGKPFEVRSADWRLEQSEVRNIATADTMDDVWVCFFPDRSKSAGPSCNEMDAQHHAVDRWQLLWEVSP